MLETKTNLEKKRDNINHTMELVRTIIPLIILVLQVVILVKLFAQKGEQDTFRTTSQKRLQTIKWGGSGAKRLTIKQDFQK